ncbi:MAG: hypothetical protein OEZ06_28335 [Myxococcales bacterium]|nr:hypothetical protein [Myxococcales bacterium]
MGARAEFDAFFVRHGPFAMRVVRRFDVAESVLASTCQNVFLVVHLKLPEFEGRASARAGFCRACARGASDCRKRAHLRRETEPLERASTPAPAPRWARRKC